MYNKGTNSDNTLVKEEMSKEKNQDNKSKQEGFLDSPRNSKDKIEK